jgi:hypothetical protein
MQGAAEEESQDSAFLRRALLEAGIGAVSPALNDDCPCGACGTTTTLLPVPRTTHPPRVGWYRQLLFEIAEPVVLSAE